MTKLDRLSASEAEGDRPLVLDVTERWSGWCTIPGSYHIPLGSFGNAWESWTGRSRLSYTAPLESDPITARILSQNGFENVKVLEGGISFYKSIHHRDFEEKGPGRTGSGEQVEEREVMRKSVKVNCCGLQCPGPIMKVQESIGEMEDGDILEVSATDMGFSAISHPGADRPATPWWGQNGRAGRASF